VVAQKNEPRRVGLVCGGVFAKNRKNFSEFVCPSTLIRIKMKTTPPLNHVFFGGLVAVNDNHRFPASQTICYSANQPHPTRNWYWFVYELK
jgi:hypothetical protein